MADSEGYRPRRFIADVSSTPDGVQPVLHMVKCPFCRVHVGGEQNFREHLHKDCEEAPREVNHEHTEWRDEIEELAREDEESERSVSERYADEDTPGEVLPV
ncbi:MAG: hypothetical protein U5J64_00960 [Halobacteriales archaeon]|nr:hypothetical protein [Halobacteriales archaeon]